MPRGEIHINLPPELSIMSFEIIEMAAVSAKRSIRKNCFPKLVLTPISIKGPFIFYEKGGAGGIWGGPLKKNWLEGGGAAEKK